MTSQQRQLLEPFARSAIKQVDKGAYSADYVSWTDKIQRLLQVLGGFDWKVEVVPATWSIEQKQARGGKTYDAKVATSGAGDANEPVAVIGTLTCYIDGTLRSVDGVGTGVDAKKAETDAFSRACAKIGVGLHLWAQGGTKDGGYWIANVMDKEGAQPKSGADKPTTNNVDKVNREATPDDDDPTRPF